MPESFEERIQEPAFRARLRNGDSEARSFLDSGLCALTSPLLVKLGVPAAVRPAILDSVGRAANEHLVDRSRPIPGLSAFLDELTWKAIIDVAHLARIAGLVVPPFLRKKNVAEADIRRYVDETLTSAWLFLSSNPERPSNISEFLRFRSWGVLRAWGRPPWEGGHPPPIDPPAVGQAPPDAALLLSEAIAALKSCLTCLGPTHLAAVEQKYFQHRSYAEIASKLGQTSGGVGATLSAALLRLRECMERRGYDRW